MSVQVQETVDYKLLHRIAHAGARLAKARRERNIAAAQLITSIPPEVRGLKSTLLTLLKARSPEFFELYEKREKLLTEWKAMNVEVIQRLSIAMKEYFKAAEEVAILSEQLKLE